MSENKEKMPKIRFPGFTGDWEQRKLGDEVQIKDSARIPNALWKKDGVPYLRSSNLDNATDEMLYISQKDYEIYKSKTGAPELGDVLFNSGGNIGTAILKSDDKPVYVQGGAVLYIKTSTSKKLDGMYLKYYFETPVQKKYILQTCVGGTIKHFTLAPANAMPITYPKIDEQIRIGAFFNTLDNLIALHQRKLNNVQNLKAGLLQKMFPKDGEDFPEVRFPGFTDAWEQCKLGEVAERIVRKNKNLESTLPLTISSLYGLVDQITYFNKRVASKDVSNYYLVKRGEFAYNKSYSDGYPWGSIKRLDRYEMGVLSTLYIVFALNEGIVNSDYLVSYYDTDNWHKEVAVRAAEGARNHGLLNISADDFFDTELKFPKDLAEQAQIGEFFKVLDHLITLHQRKLKHLQERKQALLQQMFV